MRWSKAGTNTPRLARLSGHASTSNDDPAVPPKVDVTMAYSYYAIYDVVLRAYDAPDVKPTLMIEANYEGENNGGGPPTTTRRSSGTSAARTERPRQRWFTTAGPGWNLRLITQPDADIVEDLVAPATGPVSATASGDTGVWVMQAVAFR